MNKLIAVLAFALLTTAGFAQVGELGPAAALRASAKVTATDALSTASLPTTGRVPKYVVFLATVSPSTLVNVQLKPAGAPSGNPASTGYFVADGYSTATLQNTVLRVPVPALGVSSRGGKFGCWASGTGAGTSNTVKIDYKLEYE